jgi:hypothetical protein
MALSNNTQLSWAQVDSEMVEHCGNKRIAKSGTPSCSPESAGVFQIRPGKDGQQYIAVYNNHGLLEWRRHATMYSENTCTVTHLIVPSNAFETS